MVRRKTKVRTIEPGIDRRGPAQYRARIRRAGLTLTETLETLDDARRWRADTLARLRAEGGDAFAQERQQRAAAAGLTLAEICKTYRDSVCPGHKGGAGEASRLTAWERDHPLRDRALSTLTTADVADWRDARLAAGRAPDTVVYELALLHRVLEYARQEKGALLAEGVNPVSAVRRPRCGPGRDRRINWSECLRLARAAQSARVPWLWPVILLAIETGMRRGELLSLTWSDVSVRDRTAHLRDTKNGRSRTVPLSRHARRALAALDGLDGVRVVPASANAVKLSWQRCRQRAGLLDLRFHDLRHEATSRLFEKGLSIMEVASITGHEDLRMLKRYTHYDARRLADKLD